MSKFNEEVVEEINLLRTNPKKYSKKIEGYCKYFKGKILKLPDSNAGIRTEEGADAYKEAAEFLSQQERIAGLEASKGLMKIAKEFLEEVQKCDPNDLGNIDMESIIAKYGSFSGNFSRAMDFGGETPEQVISNLVVSDGDPSRGQRESLLSTDLKKVGVASGKHDTYRQCTVIVSCTKFKNTVDDDDKEDFGNEEEEEEKPKKLKPKDKEKKPVKKIEDDDEEEEYEKPKKKKKAVEESEEVGEGKTLKPRKVHLKPEPNVLKGGKKVQQKQEEEDDEDEELPPGVVKVNKSEKIVVEKGKKKKVIKITKFMEDGSKEVETIKEPVEDDEED